MIFPAIADFSGEVQPAASYGPWVLVARHGATVVVGSIVVTSGGG